MNIAIGEDIPFRRLLKSLSPPALINLLRPRIRYAGNHASWTGALEKSCGYDMPSILDRVSSSMDKVLVGEAAFERDSVPFMRHEFNWPLVSAVLIAGKHILPGESLKILDFGGSLGCSYYQNRRIIPKDIALKWMVVEQASFVERGTARFANEELSFHKDIAECGQPHIIFLCSVLQYLETPWEMLSMLVKTNPAFLYIERTPFIIGKDTDRLCIQHVPRTIYKASYPAWMLSEKQMQSAIPQTAQKLAEFEGVAGHIELSSPKGEAIEKGFLWRLDRTRA